MPGKIIEICNSVSRRKEKNINNQELISDAGKDNLKTTNRA